MSKCLLFLFCVMLTARVQADLVLQYHHISNSSPAATSTSPALFQQHLDYLARQGFDIVTLRELLKAPGAEGRKRVAITFDDAYSSIYDTAFPLLRQRGWPFTVFVATEPLDRSQAGFMSWEQLREMVRHGATIANHSVSHTHLLRQLENESPAEWKKRITEEIRFAEKRIKSETGQNAKFFAYPYGEYNTQSKRLLAELGYFAFGQQSGPLPPLNSGIFDAQILPRFPFGGVYGKLEDFSEKVLTVAMPLRSVKVFDSKLRVLEEPLLPQIERRPWLVIEVENSELLDRIHCFASGQGKIYTEKKEKQLWVRANKALGAGRSRYNCTAATKTPGEFYWYSQLFIRKRDDGNWVQE